MRKFPVFLLVDVSESMAGAALTQIEAGVRRITADLMRDPHALETVWMAVIAFAGRPRTLTPLTELADFVPPHLPIGGGTGLGAALVHLMDEIDRGVARSTASRKGDWRPLVFLLTDGVPTDDASHAVRRWGRDYADRVSLVAVSIGGGGDRHVLEEIAEEVVAFDDTAEGSFARFITWITNSVKNSTRSVTAGGGLTLGKSETVTAAGAASLPFEAVDDRYAVFTGRCRRDRAPYVVKYERHLGRIGTTDPRLAGLFQTRSYVLAGAVPVQQDYFELSDGAPSGASVQSAELIGQPDCPRCNAPFGLAVCACGGVHCVEGDGAATCPWCGKEGLYRSSSAEDGGFDIDRGRG